MIARHRSRGPESTRSLIEHMRREIISEAPDGRHVASQGDANLHQMALIESRSTSAKRTQGFIGRSRSIAISAING